MPRVYIDFSVFSAYMAQGNVHGMLEVPSLPQVGHAMSFHEPRTAVPAPAVVGFDPSIVVEHALPPVPGDSDVPIFSLADVQVTTTAEAEAVFSYFEQGFGLFTDRLQEASDD